MMGGWCMTVSGIAMIIAGFTAYVIGSPFLLPSTVALGMMTAYIGAILTAFGLIRISLFPRKD